MMFRICQTISIYDILKKFCQPIRHFGIFQEKDWIRVFQVFQEVKSEFMVMLVYDKKSKKVVQLKIKSARV